jgi:hypothetical protein
MHNSVTIRLLAEYLIPDTMVVLKSRRCIAMLMADAAVLLRGCDASSIMYFKLNMVLQTV